MISKLAKVAFGSRTASIPTATSQSLKPTVISLKMSTVGKIALVQFDYPPKTSHANSRCFTVFPPSLYLSQQQALASERLARLTHRGRLSARREIGRWRPVAGDAGAHEAPEGGDLVWARRGLQRVRMLGTEGGCLRMRVRRMKKMERTRRRTTKRTSSKQNPAASTSRSGDTSKRSGPCRACLWGAWLTLPPQTPSWSWLFCIFFIPQKRSRGEGGSPEKELRKSDLRVVAFQTPLQH